MFSSFCCFGSGRADTSFLSPSKRISVNAGLSFSAINILRNSQDRKPRPGLNLKFNYAINEFIWFSTEYTRSFTFTSIPTWKNIRSENLDFNFLLHANLDDDPLARPFGIVGIDLNRWKAEFTGEQDNYNWREIYEPGQRVHEFWPGFNLGVGFLKAWNNLGFQADFRFRISQTDIGFHIFDVCYTVTAICFPSELFRNPKDRYEWF